MNKIITNYLRLTLLEIKVYPQSHISTNFKLKIDFLKQVQESEYLSEKSTEIGKVILNLN